MRGQARGVLPRLTINAGDSFEEICEKSFEQVQKLAKAFIVLESKEELPKLYAL